ncbi:hypothetical protein [Calderihabitans maritimus]|uniref:Uncharacterized protein n=1 Tax=Calderihabitans maritimus TaxID=1246530 RepID=A0A1Z5HPQ0_9FIRM|nr:hypothetical protein [Calderihabitans maritimus]GAW91260.1 hypothetical protein KKC1_04220 [Calderihabitans maritimus]
MIPVEPVMELKFKCGTVRVYPPEKPATQEDERRLYRVLLECLVERKKEKNENTGEDIIKQVPLS